MNKENMLLVADEIEKRLPNFDMIYPHMNIVGIVKELFPIISPFGHTNAPIHLGLQVRAFDELVFARSYGVGSSISDITTLLSITLLVCQSNFLR